MFLKNKTRSTKPHETALNGDLNSCHFVDRITASIAQHHFFSNLLEHEDINVDGFARQRGVGSDVAKGVNLCYT